MIFKGFKFGMILQLAIGPVCLFIFKLASNQGLITAETGVLAVALVDAAFILLAILGIISFIENEQVKQVFRILGALIVTIFGLNIIIDVFGWHIMLNISIISSFSNSNTFIAGLLLTLSNPLTILFWAGVFSAKIAEEKLGRQDIYWFGFGAVIATLLFLTSIAIAGTFTRYFLSVTVIKILNLLVGLVLLYFAAKMVYKKV